MFQEPVQPTLRESPPTRRPGGRRGLIGLVIVACLVLVIPIVGVIATGAPQLSTITAGASPAPDASAGAKPGHGNGNGQGNNGRGPKDKALKGNGGPGRGPISISAIAGAQVSLRTDDGWTRTVTVTSTTVITKGGQAIAASDLKVGDVIRLHQVRNADGTFTVDAIVVPTPKAGGEVTAVDTRSITVRDGHGTRVLVVNGTTLYKLGSAAATKADIKVGSDVEAQGTLSGETFTATTIQIALPRVAGEVTAKTGSTITVKQADGTPATIHVTAATTYKVKGNKSATATDVAVGDQVSAQGALRADGSLDAVTVQTKGPKGQHGDQGDDDDDGAAASAAPG